MLSADVYFLLQVSFRIVSIYLKDFYISIGGIESESGIKKDRTINY